MVQALFIINACIDIIFHYSGESSTIRRCVKSKVAPRRHLLENGALANRATLQADEFLIGTCGFAGSRYAGVAAEFSATDTQ